MKFPPVLALDCGASRVSVAAFTATSEGVPVLQRVLVEPLDYDHADDHEWVKAAGEAITRLGATQRLRGRISLIVPGHLTLTKYIRVPHVDDAKRQRIIQFEARQNIPYPLEEVVWDYQIVHDDGIDFEIALCAIKLDIVEALVAECRRAGFEPTVIEPSCMAQVNAFRFCYPEVRQGTLLINIGARSSNLVILREDRYFIRNVTLAGAALTQTMAEEIGQGVQEAERVKLELSGRGAATATPEAMRAFDAARQAFTSRLTLEVTRSIANYRRQTNVEAPVRVYLTGAGSLVPELSSILAEKLKTTVEPYDPLRGVPFGPGAVEGEFRAEAHRIGEALGAALRLYDQGLARFNLLPPRVMKARAFRRRQPFYVSAAALAAGALAIPLLVDWATIGAYEEQLKTLAMQAEPLRRHANALSDNSEQIEQLKRQIAGVKGLVETKSNWITFFTDLQDRLVKVEDVWLDKLQVIRPQGQQVRISALSSNIFGGLAAAKQQQQQQQANGGETAPELRLNLAGRLLDKNNPLQKVSAESQNRVKSLLESFEDSSFIVKLENESFDTSQPGILKFDFILVVNPQRPL